MRGHELRTYHETNHGALCAVCECGWYGPPCHIPAGVEWVDGKRKTWRDRATAEGWAADEHRVQVRTVHGLPAQPRA